MKNEIKRKGVFFVLSAPSGAGKTTLCTEIMNIFPEIKLSISYTTRNKREGEINGQDYHFVDKDKFNEMIKENSFAEWAEVHGYFYGTSIETITQAEETGKDLILDIDWQGAKQIKQSLDTGIYIFILPPSLQELEKRLRKRGKDSEEVIKKRLSNAKEEIEQAPCYDYNITNDNLEESISCLKSIIIAERCRPEKLTHR